MTTEMLGMTALLVGHELSGRYRIEAPLGGGGMGVVFEATHLALGNRVAVKLLLPGLVQREEGRLRFHREARITARLDHPAIARTFDFGEDPRFGPFLVMELLRGASLSQVLASRRLTPGQALCLGEKISGALEVAHKAGVIHRDLKPSNLFLCREGEHVSLKILDFGVAFLAEDQAILGLTRPGLPIGTAAFMAPEQARGEDVDARADLYALGVTLFLALSGELPGSKRPLGELCPELPVPLVRLVEQALAAEPGARFPDAHAMRLQIRELQSLMYPGASLDALLEAPEGTPSRDTSATSAPTTQSGPSSLSPTFAPRPSAAPTPPAVSPEPPASAPPRRLARWVIPAASAAVLVLLGVAVGARSLYGNSIQTTSPLLVSSTLTSATPEASSVAPPESASAVASVAVSPHLGPSGAPLAHSAAAPSGRAAEPPRSGWPVSEATLRGRLTAAGWQVVGPAVVETFAEGKVMRLRVRKGESSGVIEQRSYEQEEHARRAEQAAGMQKRAGSRTRGGVLTAQVTPDLSQSAALLRIVQGKLARKTSSPGPSGSGRKGALQGEPSAKA